MSESNNFLDEHVPTFGITAVMPNLELKEISFAEYSGKWIFLFFFPRNFTDFDPEDILSFGECANDFEDINCQVLAASCDSAYSNLAWINKSLADRVLGGSIGIPLLSDFSKDLATALGILQHDGTPSCSMFVISPNGIIKHRSISTEKIDVNEVIRLVQSCQANTLHNEANITNDIPNERKSELLMNPSVFGGLADTKPSSSILDNCSSAAQSILGNYQYLLRKYPLQTKALTSCFVSVLAEVIGTFIKSRKTNNNTTCTTNTSLVSRLGLGFVKDLNAKRMAIFGVYGLVITGPVFHWWYGFLEKVVGSRCSSQGLAVVCKLALNQLALTPPFLLLTLAYLQYFQTLSVTKTSQMIRNTYAAALFTNWKVWTAAQAINFTVVPLDYRVLFGNLVALWWNIYLSTVS